MATIQGDPDTARAAEPVSKPDGTARACRYPFQAIELREAMRESGVTGADVMRSTGRSKGQIDQFLAGTKPMSPDTVERLPTALRVRLTCRAHERAVEARDGKVSARPPHQHVTDAVTTLGDAVAVHAEVWADGKCEDHERPKLAKAWSRHEVTVHNNVRDVSRAVAR